MPRKKKHTEGPGFQGSDGEEEEQRGLIDAKKKRSFVDAFIVISDSDGEEPKEQNGLQKKRTKQQLDRAKFAAKRKIAQMTEDEQFALALKMSEQEARQVNCQEEEEEELLRKAIAESLNSCQPSDSPAPHPAQAACMPAESHPAERGKSGIPGAEPPCPDSPRSECSSHSWSPAADGTGQTDVTKSPLVVLSRLSQDIVESSLVSSIIISPGKSWPLTRTNEQPSSPARCSPSATSPSTPGENLGSLTPTFARNTPGARRLMSRRLFSGSCGTSKAVGGEQDKQPLAGTGSSAGEPAAAGSAVLRKNRALEPSGSPRKSCGRGWPACAPQPGPSGQGTVRAEHGQWSEVSEKAPEFCALNMADEKCKQEDARDTVRYYWGIPFCPKGLDPNEYTRVILCQLEVYQKSLKQAQRQLLQKKEFGEPVVPCSSPLSQNEQGKGEQINRENGVPDDTEDGDSEGRKEPESVSWLLSTKNREAEQNPGQTFEEEKNSTSEDEPTTSYCQGPACATDQTPAKASHALFAEDVPEDGEPMQITQSISALTPLGSKRSPDIATESPAEEEITVCPETQPSPSEAIEPEREELCSASEDAPMQADGDEETGKKVSECSPSADDNVSCPLCDQGFPATEIELHAMYCNGIVGEDANEDVPVLTQRQIGTRSRAGGGRDVPTSVAIDKCEKCYLCKALVPLAQYQRHVDGCLQTASDAQGHRRLRSAKVKVESSLTVQRPQDVGRSAGRLLSMLEMAECTSADADAGAVLGAGGDPRHPPLGAEKEAGCSLGCERALPHVAFRDSPIPSPGSVPEGVGCPGDFQQQVADRLASRQQNKGSRRRRRKF
ncbi:BRCA1-A complex subunit RAP80 isoform X2 [Emydura macquarii macquarii]|uniref:BRCA1-A complex subunit RAP80 isoform X2 n=1 Tax=Emydura macquarii macquarii TaxID=1129001 RepID=UPI00352B512D